MEYHDTKQLEEMIRFYNRSTVRKQIAEMATQQVQYHDYKELEGMIRYYGVTAVRKQIAK